jgi:hypothetical protein
MSRNSISVLVVWLFLLSQALQAGPCQTLGYHKASYVAPVNHSAHHHTGFQVSHVAYGTAGYHQAYPVLLEVQKVNGHAVYSSNEYLTREALGKALDVIAQLEARLAEKQPGTGTKLIEDEFDKVLRGIPTPKNASSGKGNVQSLANNYCITCHNGKKHPLDLQDLSKLSSDDMLAVLDAVTERTMPPKEKLSNEEVRAFKAWAVAKKK